MWANDMLGIVPKYNLIRNIGMGHEMAEHPGDTKEKIDLVSGVELKGFNLPIRYPKKVRRDADYDVMFQNGFFTEKIGLLKRFKYVLRAAIYERAYATIKRMEKDDEYFNTVLQDKYKLDEEGLKLNPGDRYRLINPREMCKSARKYKKYLREKR